MPILDDEISDVTTGGGVPNASSVNSIDAITVLFVVGNGVQVELGVEYIVLGINRVGGLGVEVGVLVEVEVGVLSH